MAPKIHADSSQLVVKIKVGPSKQLCKGYFSRADGVLLNLGNFYKVEEFDQTLNILYLTLVALDKDTGIAEDNRFEKIRFF